MKKGFTLLEVIATIIVLSIIGVITFPIVNSTIKNNKERLYEQQVKTIEKAASDWGYDNIDLLPAIDESVTITVLDLKKAGLLDINLRNPKTNELIPNDTQILILLQNNKYVFNVNMESGTNIYNDFNINSPILILNGSPIEYVEYGSTYTELGAKAKGKTGNTINNIDITYQYNGSQIASIDTRQFKTYTIVYSVRDTIEGQVYATSITRTIVIRDTQAPILTIPDQATIALSQIGTFNYREGVTVTDNSSENINVDVTNLENKTGKQVITYTACDSHNNCTSKKRIINVTE